MPQKVEAWKSEHTEVLFETFEEAQAADTAYVRERLSVDICDEIKQIQKEMPVGHIIRTFGAGEIFHIAVALFKNKSSFEDLMADYIAIDKK